MHQMPTNLPDILNLLCICICSINPHPPESDDTSFDKVDHTALLQHLYGIIQLIDHTLQWFVFLSFRCVLHGGCQSRPLCFTFLQLGVIPCPILFNSCMRPLAEVIRKHWLSLDCYTNDTWQNYPDAAIYIKNIAARSHHPNLSITALAYHLIPGQQKQFYYSPINAPKDMHLNTFNNSLPYRSPTTPSYQQIPCSSKSPSPGSPSGEPFTRQHYLEQPPYQAEGHSEPWLFKNRAGNVLFTKAYKC